MTITKLWPQASSFRSHLREIIAVLKRKVVIPTGYQDETGFHFGTEPDRRRIQWPPA